MSERPTSFRDWSARQLLVGQAVVGLCLLLLIAFAARSIALGDGRGGWAMYSHNVQFIVTYEWVFADGRREPHFPGVEIQGRASHLRMRAPKSPVELSPRNSRYGLWTLKSWLGNYVTFLYRHRRPKDALEIVATLHYAVNQPLQLDVEIPYRDSLGNTQTFMPDIDVQSNATVTVIRHNENGLTTATLN